MSKKMSIAGLKKIGGVLTGQAIERNIKWTNVDDDGKKTEHEFTVGVVKLGLAATERIWAPVQNGDEERSSWAMLICETIRLGDKFDERISYEDACNLNPSLFSALSEAANSVNPRPEGDEGKD